MIRSNPSYYAKLLLFGEYSILLGSTALSLPYSNFSAEFSFIKENNNTNLKEAAESQKHLYDLLISLEESGNFNEILDLQSFQKDLKNGLFFESTIPQSYGLGSSGAVVAGIYSRYSSIEKTGEKLSIEEMEKLRKIFSKMEAFFHGTSSGIDPLTIYISQPLFINKEKKPSVVDIQQNTENNPTSVYLIDTGCSGKTNPLVTGFLEQFLPEGKMNEGAKEFVRITDQCIQHLLNGNKSNFWQSLSELSAFQLKYMYKLIPEKMLRVWKDGLDSESLIMKLCGSGGGGYLTAFAIDKKKAEHFFNSNELLHIPVLI